MATHIKSETPALFITGTDTGVGKTAVTCAIAIALADQGLRVGVCKPIATGCERVAGHWVSDDARALARHCNVDLALNEIQPIGYQTPLAPAVAAAQTGVPVDFRQVMRTLASTAATSDVLLIEGIGGVAVPLSARRTVLDLIADCGAPAVVVTRPDLGTLNHTALTCHALQERGITLAGLVINGHKPDADDPSVQTNPHWLARQNHTTVLATLPRVSGVAPHQRRLPAAVIDAARGVNWLRLARQTF